MKVTLRSKGPQVWLAALFQRLRRRFGQRERQMQIGKREREDCVEMVECIGEEIRHLKQRVAALEEQSRLISPGMPSKELVTAHNEVLIELIEYACSNGAERPYHYDDIVRAKEAFEKWGSDYVL